MHRTGENSSKSDTVKKEFKNIFYEELDKNLNRFAKFDIKMIVRDLSVIIGRIE